MDVAPAGRDRWSRMMNPARADARGLGWGHSLVVSGCQVDRFDIAYGNAARDRTFERRADLLRQELPDLRRNCGREEVVGQQAPTAEQFCASVVMSIVDTAAVTMRPVSKRIKFSQAHPSHQAFHLVVRFVETLVLSDHGREQRLAGRSAATAACTKHDAAGARRC
ncbi:MAG: hypothetical protein J2P23_08050 [Microlunatus sp.]|nr:hypothetical protein [Microlunatus sp.]